MPDGTYFVYERALPEDRDWEYVLVVVYKGKPTHHLLATNPGHAGFWTVNGGLYGDAHEILFETITELQKPQKGWPVILSRPRKPPPGAEPPPTRNVHDANDASDDDETETESETDDDDESDVPTRDGHDATDASDDDEDEDESESEAETDEDEDESESDSSGEEAESLPPLLDGASIAALVASSPGANEATVAAYLLRIQISCLLGIPEELGPDGKVTVPATTSITELKAALQLLKVPAGEIKKCIEKSDMVALVRARIAEHDATEIRLAAQRKAESNSWAAASAAGTATTADVTKTLDDATAAAFAAAAAERAASTSVAKAESLMQMTEESANLRAENAELRAVKAELQAKMAADKSNVGSQFTTGMKVFYSPDAGASLQVMTVHSILCCL